MTHLCKILCAGSVLVAWVMLAGCDTVPKSNPPLGTSGRLRNQKQFTLEPIAMSGMTVDGMTESAFLASKDKEAGDRWEGDKVAIEEFFQEWLYKTAAERGFTIDRPPGKMPFIIRPSLISVETGRYKIPAWNVKSRIVMKVVILDREGKTVDEFVIKDTSHVNSFSDLASGGRLRSIATMLGIRVVQHLELVSQP